MSVNEQQEMQPRLTAAARERLTEELGRMRAQREELVASLSMDETRGDSADQAAAVERGTELERVDRRIEEISDLLHAAGDVDPSGDEVELGTLVTLRFDNGDTETVQVGTMAMGSDDTATVTPDSPLGKALLGHREGETVTYTTPRGEGSARVVRVQVG